MELDNRIVGEQNTLSLLTYLHRFGWLKLATLLGNVAIIVYLVRIALQPRHGNRV